MIRAQCLATAALLSGLAAPQPLWAQTVSPIPAPILATQPPLPTAADTPTPADTPLDLFYAARNQAPVWLKDEAGRAAAQSFAAILRNAALDGLADGPELASRVEEAIARGQPADGDQRPPGSSAAPKAARFVSSPRL